MSAPIGNNYAAGNEGGRPTEYNKKYCKIAYKLCLMGATDKDLAESFEVSETTITNWKQQHKEFLAAIKKGKEVADSEVADRLFKRATGYSHSDVDIKMFEGEIITTKLIKHYPPDTTAAIFWLKNRQKQKWRDKTEADVNVKIGKDLADEKYE